MGETKSKEGRQEKEVGKKGKGCQELVSVGGHRKKMRGILNREEVWRGDNEQNCAGSFEAEVTEECLGSQHPVCQQSVYQFASQSVR